MERRLTAILFADVVGYTKMMGADEAGTLWALRRHRSEFIEPNFADHRGRIVKWMGDGVLVEFASVVDAVSCANAMQIGMAERNRDGADPDIIFRVGINLGDVIVEDDDLYGDGVNLAARLEELAEPGGICMSAKVYEEVKNKLPLSYTNLGDQELKNVAEPIHAYMIILGGVDASFTADPDIDLALPQKPSIAVLPFENLSGDPEQEYLADGISEDLMTALSKIRWFFVIARNSTFTYKNTHVDVSQVAKELGVRYVLEGSVRKAGNRVRITAQLVDAPTGHHVWADRYDSEIEDIFDLQDEMTRTIIGAVEPEISAAERDRALTKQPENLDAWESYQRGLWHMWSFELDDHIPALTLLKRATELDPSLAPAYAYGAYAHYLSVVMGWTEDAPRSLDEGLTSARQALSLDDRDPLAYIAVARIHMMQGNLDDSIASLETALGLNPSSALGYHSLGMALTLAGQLDEGISALRQSERLSPRDPINWAATAVHSLACILAGDYEEGLYWARKTAQNPQQRGTGLMRFWQPRLPSSGSWTRPRRLQIALLKFCQHFPSRTCRRLIRPGNQMGSIAIWTAYGWQVFLSDLVAIGCSDWLTRWPSISCCMI